MTTPVRAPGGAERPAGPAGGMPAPGRLAAVVLNYRTPDDTLLAARSLLLSRRVPDAILVVDNDPHGCEAALAPLGRGIAYMRTGRNLGFAAGMNVGIRAALADGADRVLLLNSDAMVAPDCLARLEHVLATWPQAGIAGPMVLSRARPDRTASLGLSFDKATGRMRHHGAGQPVPGMAPPRVVDAVSGCCMLVVREVFERVGLLDDEYFFGFEDLDFCLRAREAGFHSVLAPGALAYHEGGRSIGRASPRRLYFASRNHLRLARRVAPGTGVGPLARAAWILTLNLGHAVRSDGGSLAARLAAVLRGAYDHVRGRYGGP